jgi:hypothetical protein
MPADAEGVDAPHIRAYLLSEERRTSEPYPRHTISGTSACSSTGSPARASARIRTPSIDYRSNVRKGTLERAAEDAPAGSASDRDQVSRRAERLAALLEDSHLLLVNDIPAEMFYVDVAMSTKEALDALARSPYDVVISDMRRGEVTDAGIRFINESRSLGIYRPTIFSVGLFDPSLGTPAYAYGITNRVDELLNLVFDVLERVRG